MAQDSDKQEETPRYHGRDIAVLRATLEKCPILLGSATPSLESYHNTTTGKYELLRMTTLSSVIRPDPSAGTSTEVHGTSL